MIQRALSLAGLWLALAMVCQAGSPNSVFIPEDNEITTTIDDMAVQKNLQWAKGVKPKFYYVEFPANSMSIFYPDFSAHETYRKNPGAAIEAIKRSLQAWNNSGFNTFQFDTEPAPAWARRVPYFDDLGRIDYRNVDSSGADGVNVITFGDQISNADVMGVTVITFFQRDYDPSKAGIGVQIPGSVLGDMGGYPVSGNNGTVDGGLTITTLYGTVDLNDDGRVDAFFPVKAYRAGEIIDTDILFNGSSAVAKFRLWPEKKSDIPGEYNYATDVVGSLDFEMLLMHQLGWARGLGASMIYDSVMSPYFNSRAKTYPTDPYKKRQLTFDDKMTIGIVDGMTKFGGYGAIGGQVLNGAAISAGLNDTVTTGTTTTPTTPETELLTEYIVQMPVFVAVRPSTIPSIPLLKDTFDPATIHPDNVEANPVKPDENQGTYRLVAHVLSGQDLALPGGPGSGLFFEFENGDTTDPAAGDDEYTGGDPNDQTGTGTEPGTAVITPPRLNGTYLIPGLPPTDLNGKPVDYAVYLAHTLRGTSTAGLYCNPLQSLMAALFDVEWPSEFYGGPTVPSPFGTGNAPVTINTADDRFENRYITGQINAEGRLAAAINDGPALLSGFGADPKSYVVLGTEDGMFSNKTNTIANIDQPVKIRDTSASAAGSWNKPGEFNFMTQYKVSDPATGGEDRALDVIYTITNNSGSSQTYTLRQVLDTALFGRENPIYVVNDQVQQFATTLSGAGLPEQLVYQTSLVDPAFRAYIQLKGLGVDTPDKVTMAPLAQLGQTISGQGTPLRGNNALSLDSGVALTWNFALSDGQKKIIRFRLGYLSPGMINDTWVPYPGTGENATPVDPTQNVELTGLEDDPGKVKLINVQPNEILDNIDIITNNGTAPATESNPPVEEGSAAGPLKFELQDGAFPAVSVMTSGGALADLDKDGDLDLVTSCRGGGAGVNNGNVNRIYLNEQRVGRDGAVTHYFRDVTFGEDGIPNTDDDRFKSNNTPEQFEQSVGVLVADFDNDGFVDIFFTVQKGPNRIFRNFGADGRPGFFEEEDMSPDYPIPGLLNDGPQAFDYPSRAKAGDIDSDGDLDIIISQMLPFDDSHGGRFYPSVAWIDNDPRSLQEGPYGDRIYSRDQDYYSMPLQYTERVLINQLRVPPYAAAWNLEKRGPWKFIDETLGTDDRAGTITSLEISRYNGPFQWQQTEYWEPSELDRMAPVFPTMFNVQANDLRFNQTAASPMSVHAVEPHLGPMFGAAALDLFSVRCYPDLFSTTEEVLVPLTIANPQGGEGLPRVITDSVLRTGALIEPGYGRESAYFRNMDLFSNESGTLGSDGVADGYFSCMNYNIDFGAETGQDFSATNIVPASGLFVYEEDFSEDANLRQLRHDAFPLFIGVPEGHPCDYPGRWGDAPEGDVVAPVGRSAWTGLIGDWLNMGAGRPLLAPDEDDSGGPFFLFNIMATNHTIMFGEGVMRKHENVNLYGGMALTYRTPHTYPYQYDQDWSPALINWPAKDIPVTKVGEPYSMASGDFDHDGDLDVFIVNSGLTGITRWQSNGDLFWQLTPAVPKQLLLNDSFGNFSEASTALSPNTATNGIAALAGDINNDGADDLVVLNAMSPNELFLNKIYEKAPDLEDDEDATLFYDATFQTIPQVQDLGAASDGLGRISLFTGLTVGATVADLNMDQRPDLILAEGGKKAAFGDFSRVLLNTGRDNHAEAVPVFTPAGAGYPAPKTDLFIHNLAPYSLGQWAENEFGSFWNGYVGIPGSPDFTNDIAAGDVDGDGDPDLVLARAGKGPWLLINQDSDQAHINTVPDANALGDAILDPSDKVPALRDPDGLSGAKAKKNSNQKVRLADLNGDRLIDIVLANGSGNAETGTGSGGNDNGASFTGAPNVVLLNDANDPGRFVDATEQALPTVTENGLARGLYDNTVDVAAADFDADGDVDLIFINQNSSVAPLGCRYLQNDGSGHFSEVAGGLPQYLDRKPFSIVVGDFDRLAEPTEDKNYNGILDPGEDTNGNGALDYTHLPSEITEENGHEVRKDLNNDGIFVKRRDNAWDGSLDLFISFEDGSNAILINDPEHPGLFHEETLQRFPGQLETMPTRGATAADIDLDGDLDIAVARYVGGVNSPVVLWKNGTKLIEGRTRYGFFSDISYEVPYPRGMANYDEVLEGSTGATDESSSGWAYDVKFLDVDSDGDQDMFVAGLGTFFTAHTGALDFCYMNRLIGDSWNKSESQVKPLAAGNPVVYAASPAGAGLDKEVKVVLTGANFQGWTLGTPIGQDTYNYSNTWTVNSAGEVVFKNGTTVSFGPGVSVLSMKKLDDKHFEVTVKVAANATVGPRAITAVNPTGGSSTTKPGVFNVVDRMGTSEYKNAVPNRVWTIYQ